MGLATPVRVTISLRSPKDSGIIVYKFPGSSESGTLPGMQALIVLVLTTEKQQMTHENITCKSPDI